MNLEWLLERQIAWISQADSKLAVLGPLPLAMLAISLSMVSVDFSNLGWVDFPLAASTILLCVSLFFAKVALAPRLNGPSSSLLYFGGIGRLSEKDFSERIDNLTDETYRSDLLAQIYVNAVIADSKHRTIGKSIFWLACATPLWLLTIALEF